MDETVTLTLSPDTIRQLLCGLACLSYPFWGAVTAGLYGRYVWNFTTPLNGKEKSYLAGIGLLWPAALPVLLATKLMQHTYGRVACSFLKPTYLKS